MKLRVAALFLVVIALAATASHIDDEATTVKDSSCYTCHFEGGSGLGPALREMFRIVPEPLSITPGDTANLDVTIRNWWTSELSDFEGRLDLSDAPAFAFADAPPPVLDQRSVGELPFSYTALSAPERTDRLTVNVPFGGTDFALRLIPDVTEGDNAPDLILRLWQPAASPDGAPTYIVDAAGAGATETIELTGDPVPDGAWTVEVAQSGFIEAPDSSKLSPQGFTIAWDLLYEYDDPIRFAKSTATLDGQDQESPQSTAMSWAVQLVQAVDAPQAIHIEVVGRAFYDHPDQFGAEDIAYIVHERTVIIEPAAPEPGEAPGTDGNGTVNFGGDGDSSGPDLTEDLSSPASVWGEIIGYFAAFLLVVSLFSGGAFGHWSRRLQNWMLFRKSKRRIAFHNVVSYALTAAAIIHLIVFLVETRFPWSLGMLLGGASLLGMLFAGLTGAFQVAVIRATGYEVWRWLHWASFALAFAGAVAHIVLDGIHFTEFQDLIGWDDPLRPVLDGLIPPAPAVQT